MSEPTAPAGADQPRRLDRWPSVRLIAVGVASAVLFDFGVLVAAMIVISMLPDSRFTLGVLGPIVAIPALVFGAMWLGRAGRPLWDRRRLLGLGVVVLVLLAPLIPIARMSIDGWRSGMCGSWRFRTTMDMRDTVGACRAWLDEHDELPPTVMLLYAVGLANLPDLTDDCGPGFAGRLMLGAIPLDDVLASRITLEEARAEAAKVARPPSGWEQVGWQWYCVEARAYESESGDVPLAIGLADPRGQWVSALFADTHSERIERTDAKRIAEITARLHELDLNLPAPARSFFGLDAPSAE